MYSWQITYVLILEHHITFDLQVCLWHLFIVCMFYIGAYISFNLSFSIFSLFSPSQITHTSTSTTTYTHTHTHKMYGHTNRRNIHTQIVMWEIFAYEETVRAESG